MSWVYAHLSSQSRSSASVQSTFPSWWSLGHSLVSAQRESSPGPRWWSRAADSPLPTLREVVGSQASQRRLDASLGCVRTGRALPGQCRWVVRRSWELWERKSELEFVMPLLKELNCKKSDSKLTQMNGLSSGMREGLFFIPFANAHKGHRCCGLSAWGTEPLPGDPSAIMEDMFQWLEQQETASLASTSPLALRKISLVYIHLNWIPISVKITPEVSASLLLKVVRCPVVANALYKVV